jgi:hypothetical protein
MRFVTAVALLLGGCVDVAGGAVEARWDLRDALANRIDCARAAVAQMRFALTPADGGIDPCDVEPRCTFACDRGVGTTPFIIPEGQYSMVLRPLDGGGQAIGPEQGITTPAPIVRSVYSGRLTDLSVNLIIVTR